MKVITGKAGGLYLKSPDKSRPTSDKVKQAIFNSISNIIDIENKTVLDLFAGSGAFGIEALSRGAAISVFVDNSKNAIDIINQNLTHTNLLERAKILLTDYKRFLKNTDMIFDIIFIDPPYKSDYYFKALDIINSGNLLKGILILEADNNKNSMEFHNYNVLKNLKHGSTQVFILGC